jgi:plastocyanin
MEVGDQNQKKQYCMKINNSIQRKKVAALVVTSLLAAFVHISQGATVTVNIDGDSFSPSLVTIHVGDTITWSGLANNHNVTGTTAQDLDQFCGASLNSFDTESNCSQTFMTAGTFPYECTIHANCCGMTGVVTVVAATPTPTVSITNPASAATFTAPASVSISASAAVSSGTVTNVAFFGKTNNVTASLGAAHSAPFTITAANLAAGSYALTAVATAAGISATSAVVNITVVTPVAVSNSVPGIAGGQFSFDYTANPGLTYVVEISSNLLNWLPIGTNVASNNPVIFTDSSGLGAQRFYQVVRQPNP